MAVSSSMTRLNLIPFWGRVAVVESPVEETEHRSGLIVPLKYEGSSPFRRGIVLEIDQTYHEKLGPYGEYARQIEKGTVVFFRQGFLIGDTWIVDIDDILAFENPEG